MSKSASKLRRIRTVAQAVAVVAAASAGMVGAVGLPGLEAPAPVIPPTGVQPDPVTPSTDDPTDRVSTTHSSGLIAGSLGGIANAPLPPEEPVENTGDVLTETDPDPAESTDLRYIGRMASRAVLVIDDSQRLLSQGDSFSGVELLEIEPDYVIVLVDEDRKRIERDGAKLSRVTSADAPTTLPTTKTPLHGGKPNPAGAAIERGKAGGGAAAADMSELSRRIRARSEAASAEEAGEE